MAVLQMRQVWQARRLVLQGVSIKKIAEELKTSESTVRQYTKAERERVKIEPQLIYR